MSEAKKKRILAVDDDIDLLEQVVMELRSEGYEVTQAEGQKEAEAALAEGGVPDLAVVDLMMENMDSGFILCHRIKGMNPETPVIIMTAVTAETGLDFDVTSAMEQSWIKADLVLDKPVRGEQLRSAVTRLLRE